VAKKTVYTFVDDIDGSPAEETVRFSLNKEAYEIDLSKANAKKLRDALAAYVNAGRRVAGGRGRATSRPAARRGRTRAAGANGGAAPADVRAWAKSNGIKVNERGRIAADVVERYNAAH
jgi:hypothetical protein